MLWYSGSEKDYSNNSTAIGNVWQSCKLAPGDLYATDAITDITSKYFKQWIQQSVLAFSEYNAWQIVTINEDLPSRIDEMFKSDSFGEINFGDKYNALLKEQWNSVLLSASYSYDTSVLLDVSAAGELMLLQLDFAVNSNRDAWTIPKQKVFEKLENTFMLLRNSTLQLLLFRSKVIEKRKDDETFNGLIEEHRLRTEILSHCLMILSTEGTKIPSLLNTIQEALGRLTNVRSTHLSCIDNISGKLLYEASAEFGTVVSNTIIPDNTDYQSVTNSISQTKESWNNSVAHRAVGDTPNKTSMNSPAADRSLADSVFATPSPLSAKSFSPSKTVHYAPNLFDHNGRLSAMSSPTMMSPASRSVSYVSLTNPGKANSVASINTEPFVLSPILRNSSTYPGYSNNVYHDHNNNPPVSSDRVAYQVREYVFDCYEVSGTLTITYDYTKPELEQENLHRNESVQSHQSTTKKSKYFFNDDAGKFAYYLSHYPYSLPLLIRSSKWIYSNR